MSSPSSLPSSLLRCRTRKMGNVIRLEFFVRWTLFATTSLMLLNRKEKRRMKEIKRKRSKCDEEKQYDAHTRKNLLFVEMEFSENHAGHPFSSVVKKTKKKECEEESSACKERTWNFYVTIDRQWMTLNKDNDDNDDGFEYSLNLYSS